MSSLELATSVVTALLGLVVWLLQNKIGRMEKDIEKAVEKAEELENNYLAKFVEVNKNISDKSENILKEIHKLGIKIAENNGRRN